MRIVIAGLVVLGLVANIGACSDEAPDADDGVSSSSGGTSSGGSGNGGGVEAGSLGDSATGRAAPERLCDPLTQRGTSVEEVVYPGEPPPPFGGTIQPGTYELVILERYSGGGPPPQGEDEDGGETPPDPPSGQGGRATIYVLGNAIRFIEAYGATASLPQDSTRGVSYVVKGTSLETIEECPSAGKTKSIPFTVQGTTLTLYTDTQRQLFQRSLEQQE